MYKIAAVSYLNTLPFINGIKNNFNDDEVELRLSYPSKCAEFLIQGYVDLALVPTATLLLLDKFELITDYCIGADDYVDTVSLFSNNPINEIKKIYLDYQSRTSIELVKILLNEYWGISPELVSTSFGYEEHVGNNEAALIIGDRAFSYKNYFSHNYDLSNAWKNLTGLPFVFALWVSTKKLPKDFKFSFNNALKSGLNNIDNQFFLKINKTICPDPLDYLRNKISYDLDEDKKKAIDVFLNKIII